MDCTICGSPLVRAQDGVLPRKYCSRECRLSAKRERQRLIAAPQLSGCFCGGPLSEAMMVPLYRENRLHSYAVVDAEDYLQVAGWLWRPTAGGYAQRSGEDGARYYMHRLILGLKPGDDAQADHINGDRLDNRRANLRVATVAENAQNRHAVRSRSGYLNVYWHNQTGKWSASTQVGGERRHLGLFTTPEQAAERVAAYRATVAPFSAQARSAS